MAISRATDTEGNAHAGGCFWGLELAYQRVPGVIKTSVGYTGGHDPCPNYNSVCSGRTGHAEAVQVTDEAHAHFSNTLEGVNEHKLKLSCSACANSGIAPSLHRD